MAHNWNDHQAVGGHPSQASSEHRCRRRSTQSPRIWYLAIGAAGFINGVGHWWGYRNGETKDHSRNIVPWGILIGGEELHNNHHLDPANPRLSRRWFEFDLGWMWFKLFNYIGLAKLRNA